MWAPVNRNFAGVAQLVEQVGSFVSFWILQSTIIEGGKDEKR